MPKQSSMTDFIGQKFGHWTVIACGETIRGSRYVLCECKCGKQRSVRVNVLEQSQSQSCGCLAAELTRQRNFRHGQYGTPEYRTWQRILARCGNPNYPHYEIYGGRGIKVCERWKDSFTDFVTDMGQRPDGKYSIDRIDVDGDYEPSNCRWANIEQQQNNRRNNRSLTYNDETMTIAQWARRLNVSPERIRGRLEAGWSIENALTEPHRPLGRIYSRICKTCSDTFQAGASALLCYKCKKEKPRKRSLYVM